MNIEVLICRADGTQAFETREVPDDWFAQAVQESPSAESGESAAGTETA